MVGGKRTHTVVWTPIGAPSLVNSWSAAVKDEKGKTVLRGEGWQTIRPDVNGEWKDQALIERSMRQRLAKRRAEEEDIVFEHTWPPIKEPTPPQ